MISKLKIIIQFFIYFLIDIFISSSKTIKPKSLLLIRIDGIGDYILFRNFIKIIKRDSKYKDYSITLLGNVSWRSLCEELDSEHLDNCIWLNRDKFSKDIFYRYKKLQELASTGYEVIISPVYSREYFMGDNIIKHVNANEKIGSCGDCTNMKKWQRNISDKYYNTLISARDDVIFEFSRNKEFFENLLENKINIFKPSIKKQKNNLKYKLPDKYAVFFIGASIDFRKWSIENFVEIGNYLNEHYSYDIVLCGTSADIEKANHFEDKYNDKALNLVGKTSLVELLTIISSGDLILSNDTSAAHLAVSSEIPNTFVISNGNTYGRFVPYPEEISRNYHAIYHPDIDNNLDNYKKISSSYGFRTNLNINQISFDKVKKKIDRVLENIED